MGLLQKTLAVATLIAVLQMTAAVLQITSTVRGQHR